MNKKAMLVATLAVLLMGLYVGFIVVWAHFCAMSFKNSNFGLLVLILPFLVVMWLTAYVTALQTPKN